jgi:hypothetical protein
LLALIDERHWRSRAASFFTGTITETNGRVLTGAPAVVAGVSTTAALTVPPLPIDVLQAGGRRPS